MKAAACRQEVTAAETKLQLGGIRAMARASASSRVHNKVNHRDESVTCKTTGTSVPTQHNMGQLQGTGWSLGGILHISGWLCCQSQIDCNTCCTALAHSAQHLQLHLARLW